MRSQVLTRKPRAAPEHSFSLGEPPLDQIAKKSNQLALATMRKLRLCGDSAPLARSAFGAR